MANFLANVWVNLSTLNEKHSTINNYIAEATFKNCCLRIADKKLLTFLDAIRYGDFCFNYYYLNDVKH